MGLKGQQNGITDWIIDSGASRHLTANQNLLDDYINILPTAITIGNGKEITAVGQGNIIIPTTSGSIRLTSVLQVPDIGSNLISVASIVDQGFQVEFTKTTGSLSKGNTAQGIGKRQGNKPRNWASGFRVDPGLDRVGSGRVRGAGVWVGSGRPSCKPG